MGIDDKKKDLLKKLYTLAERGEAGEKEVARNRLDALLAKYRISEEELRDEVVKMYWFTCRNEWERKLFAQVVYKVTATNSTWRRTAGKGQRTEQGAKCTAAQAAQIRIEYEFYKQLWSEDLEFFFSAFIQKHRIFDLSPGHETDDEPNWDDLLRMKMLMNGMQDRELLKMIEE